MKRSTPPPVPDEPYANIRVDTDGHFAVSWGLGFVGTTAYRRSVNAAIRLRDRRLRQMMARYERKKLAERALQERTDTANG